MLTKPDWKSMSGEERSQMVRPLAADGLASSKIAAVFLNATRNAIISHCSRYGIGLGRPGFDRPRTTRPMAEPKPRAAPRPKQPKVKPPRPIGQTASKPLPIARVQEDMTHALPFLDALIAGVCKWPLWQEFSADAQCCGAERVTGSPYCDHHVSRMRQR